MSGFGGGGPRWVRTFPMSIPSRRAYVCDELERVYLANYDMTPLAALHADLIVCEWDIALSREDRARFIEEVARTPERVRVAPYTLYTVAQKSVFAHRCINTAGEERWVGTWDAYADYFGFGLIYLPYALLRGFLDAPAPARGRSPYLPSEAGYSDCRMTDQTFSIWHRHSLGQRAQIAWDVRPVHLHY